MTGDPIQTTAPAQNNARFSGAPSLAFSFLVVGIAYALPILLFPRDYPMNGPVSPEILNLNLLVAWMGLAHFIFAYSGQARSLRAGNREAVVLFVVSVLVGGLFLGIFRHFAGTRLFDSVVWVYFLPHIIKAELHFIKNCQPDLCPSARVLYWFPAIGFSFFTFALFGPFALTYHTGALIGFAVLCVAAGLTGHVMGQLSEPSYAPYALLGFFFIGEGLVWDAYSKYMSPQFRQGLYVFHIAVASFYHYFRSYGFTLRKLPAERMEDYIKTIVIVNTLLIGFGVLVLFFMPQVKPAQFIFGLPYFTFWVGLHLVASDLFTALRKIRLRCK